MGEYLKMKIGKQKNILLAFGLIAVIIISFFYFFRIDLTSDKRFSIAEPSKKLMAKVDAPLEVTVYLDGDLNPSFQRLKRSTAELLEELSVYSNKTIHIKYENPSLSDTQEEREKKYAELQQRGLSATAVYERDKEGKSIQKVIFPWIEISYNGKKLPICLLKNIRGN